MTEPTTIGRYAIEKVLGQGGMGRVYLARDSVLGRRVAVKVLRGDLGLPPETRDALLSRMKNEARAAAAISHPHIVTLHDMGEDDELGLYLVFEYVEGPTLRERLEKGPLELAEVARIGEELGAALTVAHQAGVVHRDVKPENVILAKTGAKIADFGIARAPDSTLTQVQSVFATTAYGAPEALATGDFGPASDQFSLAATLFEAVSGERAFPGQDALAVAARIANDEPATLVARGGADARIVGRVEGVLRKAMAKAPAGRFATAADFGAALAKSIRDPAPSLGSQVIRTPAPSSMTRTSTPPPAPAARADNPRAWVESPVRPSLVMRQQTHRLQNVVAALAILTIAGLVVFGRKRARDDDDAPAASASTNAAAAPSHGPSPTRPPLHVPGQASQASQGPHRAGAAAHDAGAAPSASAAPAPSAAPTDNASP